MTQTNIIDSLHDVNNGNQALVQIIRSLQKEIEEIKKINGKNYEALNLELMTQLDSGTDLNLLTETGSYWMQDGNSARNKPSEMTNNSIRIIVKSINPNNIQQTIVTAISDQNFTRVYQFSSKSWSKWNLH